MVKSNQLRLGNFINYGNHALVIVSGLRGEKIQVRHTEQHSINNGYIKSSLFDSDVDGIQLTEERLVRFDFSHIKDHIRYGGVRLAVGYVMVYEQPDKSLTIRTDTPFRALELKWVHQIQNWFFALTGEELTLKETI